MNKLLEIMKNDMNGAMSNHNEQMARIFNWRADSNSVENVKTSSNKKMVMRDIQKSIESALPSLVEPFLNQDLVLVQGKDSNSQDKAEVATKLLNYQWNYGVNSLELLEELIKTNMEDGTVFLKIGWKDDKPTSELIDADKLIIDPSASKLKDVKFVIERKKVSINDILNNSSWYGKHTLDSLKSLGSASSEDYDNNINGIDESFNFEDRARQLINVHTYYGMLPNDAGELVASVGIWADDFLINIMPSPYPDAWNGIPFIGTVYTRVVGSIYGEALADLLSTNQNIRTGLNRAIMDTLDASTNGQKGVKKGTLDIVNKRKFAVGDNFEYLSQNGFDVWEGAFNDIPAHIMGYMEAVKNDSEELSGISRLNGGLDSRALNSGVSATASSLVNSNAERRLLLSARHISSLFESMFRMWLDLNMLMLESNSVNVGGQVVELSAFDVYGNFDLSINIATANQKQELSQKLSMVLQMLSANPNIPQSTIMRLTSDMTKAMDLYKTSEELSQLAQQMKQDEMMPQEPNPVEQAHMQLEMQKASADIRETESKAQLNQAKTMSEFTDATNASYGL